MNTLASGTMGLEALSYFFNLVLAGIGLFAVCLLVGLVLWGKRNERPKK